MAGGMGYGQALGGLFEIAGGALGGFSAEDHRDEFQRLMDALSRPDVSKLQTDYFTDLEKFFPRADKLSQQLRSSEMNQNLALREQALPGSTQALRDSMATLAPLLRGELPKGVMDAYVRAGGASTVGHGFGGTGYGALNTGLFGARGALGAFQTGIGLLPTLLHSLPSVSSPTTMGLLGQLLTPSQRVNLEMQLRQQQIGINSTYSAMPTMMDVWSQTLTQIGSQMMGAGGGGGGGGSYKRLPGQNPESGTWERQYGGIGDIQPQGGNVGTGE